MSKMMMMMVMMTARQLSDVFAHEFLVEVGAQQVL
jgi:hypothetical protein